MNLTLILTILLIAGAFFHIILGIFWMQQQPTATWLKWTTLIMPLVGGLGLSTQLSKSTNAKWIDYSIIGLDILTVGTMIYILFIR